ncbi:MAG: hypothetical protein Q7J27_13010 [Syntrophales bacterium]|nr:hypothetical protein [Syntrophales bacterium]
MNNQQLKRIIIFFVLFMTLVGVALAEAEKTSTLTTASNDKKHLIDSKPNSIESASFQDGSGKRQNKGINNLFTILLPAIISIFFGGFAGAIVTIIYSRRKASKEFSSLIVAFCVELVSAFERCVTYCLQLKKGEISYSTLFDFTNESTLSKFASVSQKPDIIVAIVDLKSKYFQIGRHVSEAANLAMQGACAPDKEEQDRLMKSARQAQGTAIAFFNSSYESIEKNTDLLIKTAKIISPGILVNDLSSRFTLAQEKKKLDVGK